jgi:hypothetical protein
MAGKHFEGIVGLFSKGAPKDKAVHELADKLGMSPHVLEGEIYALLASFLASGKAKGFKGKFDPAQVKKGIKVEMEHTSDERIAERIAKDHLSEIPDYYDRLDRMEKSASKTEGMGSFRSKLRIVMGAS